MSRQLGRVGIRIHACVRLGDFDSRPNQNSLKQQLRQLDIFCPSVQRRSEYKVQPVMSTVELSV